MKRCLMTAGLLLLLIACAAPTVATDLSGRIDRIYDGDTVHVAGIGKVRLLGIDAPEQEASERDNFLLRQGVKAGTLRQTALAARAALLPLRGETVRLVTPEAARDRHGRLLAYVYLADGRLLNRTLLEQGLAVVYRRFDFALKADFIAAENRARSQGQGLWQPVASAAQE